MAPEMAKSDSVTIRPARRPDAPDLARLGDMAGHGLPSFLWRRSAAPGQDPMEIGIARASRDNSGFSWTNATVAEIDGRVAAALVTCPIGDTPEPLDGLGPIVATLQALENRALGSQYVNVLAVYPEFRRRGLGRRLLAEAARLAGPRRLSLIVEDANANARRLYESFGFRVADEAPMAKEDWQTDGTTWILMERPAGA
ncbi:MAG: GNAT family N-acetyltransferase [Amaricoccus sp.]|uniref:GNAT family N-acetyltransferase n=1 Tax=Amaricoccus sp. TaxID=1872485 RepID=UPI0039E23FA9